MLSSDSVENGTYIDPLCSTNGGVYCWPAVPSVFVRMAHACRTMRRFSFEFAVKFAAV